MAIFSVSGSLRFFVMEMDGFGIQGGAREVIERLIGGNNFRTEFFEYQIGVLRIYEEDGWIYRLKKILFGVFEGNTGIALLFNSRSEFPTEEEIQSSPYLENSHPMREGLGILELEVHERERPTPDVVNSDMIQLGSEEYEAMVPEGLYREKRIAVVFNTADPTELEERLNILNQILKDVVSEDEYLRERFSQGNEN